MKDLIGQIVSAIATAEGFYAPGNPLPKRNHNPGNLRAAPSSPNVKVEGGFCVFPSDAEGIAAEMHQVALDVARGATLRTLLTKLTPPGDNNNTTNYINEAARRLGFTPAQVDQKLWELLEIEHIP